MDSSLDEDISRSWILRFLGFARFSIPKDLSCLYVFWRFFLEPTNMKSIFSGIWFEQRAFKVISGPIPDSSPTLSTNLNVFFVFWKLDY